jgi:hypothetical protein
MRLELRAFFCILAGSRAMMPASMQKEHDMAKKENAHDMVLKIKEEIMALGSVHPGRVSEQYNVCGSAGCACKDKDNPRKHGPYFYLSYSFKGRSRTNFIGKENVQEMRLRNERFVELKRLFQELIEASIDQAQEDGLRRTKSSE